MHLRRISTLLAVAVFATATAANAKVHRVFPGGDIQAAIDAASPGDTILVEPGVYTTDNPQFGLRISTDNLRLIGKVKKAKKSKDNDEDSGSSGSSSSSKSSSSSSSSSSSKGKNKAKKGGEVQKVRLVHSGTQQTGIYAAPAGCGPELGVGECSLPNLKGFVIRGFTVEDFPGNGIQTRFVTGFKMIRNESARNLNNGIYPTISANGLVLQNVSYGALDTAAWVAASENVRVIGNEFRDSVIGFEITVSNDVVVKHNDIHDNTVGIGLFHPNAAGNAQLPVMANWVVEKNNVYRNNTPNNAPSGSFQEGLPQGIGILLLGVSDHVIAENNVADNEFVGIGVLGWCTATALGDASRNCINEPPQADPSPNFNLISKNRFSGNGGNSPDFLPVPGVDILYLHAPPPAGPEAAIGNCFEKNEPSDFTFFYPGGDLPTDGC